ncbi:MAG: glycosyltransferase [Gorillibacterium sp.]|nr:glycosyltransferase [Gorillibacterium sp.]
MQPCVSIILPIYKVEAYLPACLDSILASMLREIEVILVDDGSPDRCGEIADHYAALDSRIKVIHQQNAGSSSARNAGVRLAVGEYVGFVDPDDWIADDMFSAMYAAAKRDDADAVICGLYECYEDLDTCIPVRYPFLPRLVVGQEEVHRTIMTPLLSGQLHAFTWNKIFRRSILLQHGIESPEDMPLMQDVVFNQDALSVMNRIAYVDRSLYYFRRHSASNTMKFRLDVFDTLLRLLQEKEKCLLRLHTGGESRKVVEEWFVRQTLQTIQVECSSVNPLPYAERRDRLRRIMDDEQVRRMIKTVQLKTNPFQEAVLYGLRHQSRSLVQTAAILYNQYRRAGHKLRQLLASTRPSQSQNKVSGGSERV